MKGSLPLVLVCCVTWVQMVIVCRKKEEKTFTFKSCLFQGYNGRVSLDIDLAVY